MTLDEARERVGAMVEYNGNPNAGAGDPGCITSVGGTYVFVRYFHSPNTSHATPPEHLRFVGTDPLPTERRQEGR